MKYKPIKFFTSVEANKINLADFCLKDKFYVLCKIVKTRSSLQNNALHLLFEQISALLNDMGMTFEWKGLRGNWLETKWTALLVKEHIWKPLQFALFGSDSTTKLKGKEIDEIFEALNKFFGERGVEVKFPNKWDKYLKDLENMGKI